MLPDLTRGADRRASPLFRLAVQQARGNIVHSRRLPALDPGIGINPFRFAGADVIVERGANKAVLKRCKQCGLFIHKPLRQFAAVA